MSNSNVRHLHQTIMKTLILILVSIISAAGQPPAERQKHFNLDDNLAIDGYDPVAYFSGKAREGDEDINVSHNGVVYYFVNQANLAKFQASPSKYEPAYGGWCAYAMGESGEKVKVDPETFKIVEGRLYLFYNFWGNNTLKTWNKNEPILRENADQNWKKFIH
jgi:YHS domain-containing protein